MGRAGEGEAGARAPEEPLVDHGLAEGVDGRPARPRQLGPRQLWPRTLIPDRSSAGRETNRKRPLIPTNNQLR